MNRLSAAILTALLASPLALAQDPLPPDEPFDEPIDDPMNDPINDPLNDPINDPVNDPLNDPRNDPLNDPINDPINDPLHDLINDPINDPLNDPINDPINDPLHDPINDPIDDPVNDPINDPIDDPLNEPINDPVDDPLLEPVVFTGEEGTLPEDPMIDDPYMNGAEPPPPEKAPLTDYGIDEASLGAMDQNAMQQMPPDAFGAMTSSHFQQLPPDAMPGMTPEQMAKLDSDATQGMNPDHWAQLPPATLTGLTADGLTGLTPEVMGSMQVDQFDQLPPDAMTGFKPEQLKALPPEVMAVMDSAQISQLPPDTLAEIDPDQWMNISPTAMEGFTSEQMMKMSEDKLGQLSVDHMVALSRDALGAMDGNKFRKLPAGTLQQMPADKLGGFNADVMYEFTNDELDQIPDDTFQNLPAGDRMKLMTNVDTTKVQPDKLTRVLPGDWEVVADGDDPNAYRVTPPPETPLEFRPLKQTQGNNLKLPSLPDLQNCGPYIGCTAPSPDKTEVAGMKNALNSVGLGDFGIVQDSDGELEVTGTGVAAGVRFTFMPFASGIKQAANPQPGVTADASGRFVITTSDGHEIPVVPAWANPTQVLQVLESYGNNGTAGVSVGNHGETLLTTPGNARRRGATRSTRIPDPLIEDPPTSDSTTSTVTNRRAGTSVEYFVYPDGTRQKMNPTVLNPDEFVQLGKALVPELDSLEYQADGTFLAILAGTKFRLTPNATMTTGSGKSRVEIGTQGIWFTTTYQGEVFKFLLAISAES